MDEFKIYNVTPILGVGMPLLLTAITKNEYNIWQGELYLFLTEDKATLIDYAYQIEGDKWPNSYMSLDGKFVEDELLRQAGWRLNGYLNEVEYYKKYGQLVPPLNFNLTNKTALMALWMRNNCREQIISIYRKTGSKKLKAECELLSSLPKFEALSNGH
jgi:hypothetical protein